MKKKRRQPHKERHQQQIEKYNELAKENTQRLWPECTAHYTTITDLYRSIYGNIELPEDYISDFILNPQSTQ